MIQSVLFLLLVASSQPSAKEGITRLTVATLDGQSRDVSLIRIGPDGQLTYDEAGHPRQIALEDITRIVPRVGSVAPLSQTSPARRVFHLAEGGRLSGEILDVGDGKDRRLHIDVGLSGPLAVPFHALAAIRFSVREQVDAQRELNARLADRPVDKDLLIVAQDDKTIVLPGALERLTPRDWEFKLGRKTQTAGLDAAYAVVLGGPHEMSVPASAMIKFLPDNELLARIASADDRTLAADAGALGLLHIPWRQIQSIQVRSQRVVYVSDLAPTSQQSRSALDLDFPPRLDRSVTGRQLSIRGCRFEKGIGVHAFSSLTFNLDGQFEKFLATVGIDDSAAPYGSVVFRVLVDGKPLFESRPLRGDEPAMPIAIDVRGGSVLTLECRDAGDLDISDHADWADALLLRAKASTIR